MGPIVKAVIEAEADNNIMRFDWRVFLYNNGDWKTQQAVVKHDVMVCRDNQVVTLSQLGAM
jgi:hypothetical protein